MEDTISMDHSVVHNSPHTDSLPSPNLTLNPLSSLLNHPGTTTSQLSLITTLITISQRLIMTSPHGTITTVEIIIEVDTTGVGTAITTSHGTIPEAITTTAETMVTVVEEVEATGEVDKTTTITRGRATIVTIDLVNLADLVELQLEDGVEAGMTPLLPPLVVTRAEAPIIDLVDPPVGPVVLEDGVEAGMTTIVPATHRAADLHQHQHQQHHLVEDGVEAGTTIIAPATHRAADLHQHQQHHLVDPVEDGVEAGTMLPLPPPVVAAIIPVEVTIILVEMAEGVEAETEAGTAVEEEVIMEAEAVGTITLDKNRERNRMTPHGHQEDGKINIYNMVQFQTLYLFFFSGARTAFHNKDAHLLTHLFIALNM